MLVVGCGSAPDHAPTDGHDGPHDGAAADALVSLDPTPGLYRGTCDGSGAAAIDFLHFLGVNDDDQGLRVYRRATTAAPVQQLDITIPLGLGGNDEADLEDLARVGDRIYAITSHGRNTSGELQPARYRFAALDVTGAVPALGITVAGSSSTLLVDLLAAANWDTPDPALIAALDASSQLDRATRANLAPENEGTNIEGLAALPSGPLVIGFRNPRPNSRAIVVTLTNPDAVVAGQPAHFGAAAELDLGGLGIRGMAWSPAHAAVLIIAGSHASGGPFRIYRWSGTLGDAPVVAADVTAPASGAPEAIVPYANTRDVQIIFDQGDALIGGVRCKDASASSRVFTDVIVRVE